MRVIGAVLVATGFLWLGAYAFGMHAISRGVAGGQWEEVKSWAAATGDSTLRLDKVRSVISQTAGAYSKRLPNVMLPGAVMFVGALLLARGQRGQLGKGSP